MLLSEFHSTQPRFEIIHEAALDWLATAHAEARRHSARSMVRPRHGFAGSIARVLRRIACQPDKIRKRDHSVAGCFAALPALRIASGFVAMASRRVDIVHTELCSLHFQPANHAFDQLVVRSVFAMRPRTAAWAGTYAA